LAVDDDALLPAIKEKKHFLTLGVRPINGVIVTEKKKAFSDRP